MPLIVLLFVVDYVRYVEGVLVAMMMMMMMVVVDVVVDDAYDDV
jgi:hypothetical protein